MKATKNPETNRYATMGMAALLPGMVHMLELMQNEVENFRTMLAALQANGSTPHRKTGRPAGSKNIRQSGWPADPEARKAEMKRRMKVAAQKKKGSSISEKRKAEWAAMSPAKRKKRLAAMAAGKHAPVVKMEKVA